MRFWTAPPIALLACALNLAALAGQDDQRLADLFERLQTTDNPAEARTVESLIWEIWEIWDVYDGDGQEVERLMRDGALAMRLRNHHRAEAVLTEVTELAPDFAEGWNRRATARYLAGDYTGSVADIQRTLQLEPRHFGALSGLGLIYSELEEPGNALAAFEAALEINPHMPGARANAKFLREFLREMLDGDPI